MGRWNMANWRDNLGRPGERGQPTIATLIVVSHMGPNLVVSLAFLRGPKSGRINYSEFWWRSCGNSRGCNSYLDVRDPGTPVAPAADLEMLKEQSIKL